MRAIGVSRASDRSEPRAASGLRVSVCGVCFEAMWRDNEESGRMRNAIAECPLSVYDIFAQCTCHASGGMESICHIGPDTSDIESSCHRRIVHLLCDTFTAVVC